MEEKKRAGGGVVFLGGSPLRFAGGEGVAGGGVNTIEGDVRS